MNLTINILALSLIKGVGASFIKKNLPLIEQYSQSLDLLAMIGGKVNLQELEYNIPKAQLILKDCEENSIEVISILDNNYPPLLRLINDPPPILYLKGNINLLSKAIAIIGTRKSNTLGNDIAFRVGEYFSKNWSICNGLVDGIDKHSILKENEVFENVIGVISGGLNFINTSSLVTRELCEKVLNKNGLLISENEPNKKEDRFSGSKASRIQAGLSNALILIQSDKNGGSKYTLKSFAKTERPLGIIDFKKNKEFQNEDIFSANRLIIEKRIEGIAEMCEIKKITDIRLKSIIPISKKSDYLTLEKEITAGNKVFKK